MIGIPGAYALDYFGNINNNGKNMINQELLNILACPKCKKQVQLNEKQDGLVCVTCKLVYEISDDIPTMLIDEAGTCDDEKGRVQI